jgi:ADP-ribosylation factor related protein 1
VFSAPQILGVPLLLLANKQDSPSCLSVDEIRHDYEEWQQRKIESSRRRRGMSNDAQSPVERVASLNVMGISALEGYAPFRYSVPVPCVLMILNSTGVRAAVDWLFIRVQNSRRWAVSRCCADFPLISGMMQGTRAVRTLLAAGLPRCSLFCDLSA